LSLISFCINSDSWQYRNNSERNGAAFVPIAMPMIC
jgi:small neutral amino acid transporter SnatA (MarC family)